MFALIRSLEVSDARVSTVGIPVISLEKWVVLVWLCYHVCQTESGLVGGEELKLVQQSACGFL